jgi:hypothetical protein
MASFGVWWRTVDTVERGRQRQLIGDPRLPARLGRGVDRRQAGLRGAKRGLREEARRGAFAAPSSEMPVCRAT